MLVLFAQLSFVIALSIIIYPTRALKQAGSSNTRNQLPIYRRGGGMHGRRSGSTSSIGLGDFQDVTYNVLIQVGETQTPVVLDTGSSDLWIISDQAMGCTHSKCDSRFYQTANFEPADIEARLIYGDSTTETHAYGPIGQDTVTLAGISLNGQYFAAINDTNTSVLDTGAVGIFGLGFALNSVIWTQVFQAQYPASALTLEIRDAEPPDSQEPSSKNLGNLATKFFPKFSFLQPLSRPSKATSSSLSSRSPPRQMASTGVFDSYETIAPFLLRLVAKSMMAAPMFTITLQRDTIEIGGNVGMLTLGELPTGVQNDSLTWVPVRGYSITEGGLSPPPDFPEKMYPIAWELFLDDVYLNGDKLPHSNLSSPNISLSALIDTGNSLIRGPTDVVQYITSTTDGDRFPCTSPPSLAFRIGGKLFPVDPRDYVSQIVQHSVAECWPNLVATDPPKETDGYLYSWSLGEPFLKGVLASFYYGNLSHPSQDQPRIGFLSTVPANADELLRAAVSAVSAKAGDFPVISQAAPTRTFTAASINMEGVQQATQQQMDFGTPSLIVHLENGSPPVLLWNTWVTLAIVGCLAASMCSSLVPW